MSARNEVEFEIGEAAATVPAILDIADTPEPPSRIILGKVSSNIETIYQDRLQTWRDWQQLSEKAFGSPES